MDHGHNCFIFGVSPAIRALDRSIDCIAPTEIPLLLIGERGTGKQEIALEIHYRSQHSIEPFLKFDCRLPAGQSIPAWLPRLSPTQIAKGTLFFDEIGELSSAAQQQLFERLNKPKNASEHSPMIRTVAATSHGLEDEVRNGTFSEELYFTILGICLFVPALRDRLEDIPGLVDRFLAKHADLLGRGIPRLHSSTMDILVRYPWPGNVRQLENCVAKIVEFGNETLAFKYLSMLAPHAVTSAPVAASYRPKSLKEAVSEASENVERSLILNALESTQWNQAAAARELKIGKKALYRKVRRLRLRKQ